jgi:tetratricopeptide (TPR) repeat protein
MKGEEFLNWSEEELPPETAEEVFRQLIRAIRRHEGAGWFFVQCSPAKGTETIERLRAATRIPVGSRFGKAAVAVMELDRESETLYREAKEWYERERFKILVVRGIEQALYSYEDAKRQLGWDEEQIYNYDWRGVPPLLNHLNVVRECLRDNVPCTIVFLLPPFAVKYFIFRAPDFYDWGAGFFAIPEEGGEQQVIEWVKQSKYSEYCQFSTEERIGKIAELWQVIDRGKLEDKECADLLVKQGMLFASGKDYELAISCYDRAMKIKPNYSCAGLIRAFSLDKLGKYEEATTSYEEIIKDTYNHHCLWLIRAILLRNLGKPEDAIYECERAIKIKQNYYNSWLIRGALLDDLGRYKEAVVSYDRAIQNQPENHYVWTLRGCTLDNLGRYEEAIASYDRAIKNQPNNYYVWTLQGCTLCRLGRYKEGVYSFKKALKNNPNDYNTWWILGETLLYLERYTEAIASYKKATNIYPLSFCFHFSLGLAFSLNSDFTAAKQKFKESFENCPKGDLQDRLYFALNQIILGQQESGFDLLQETLAQIQNPNEPCLIRGGVLESAEILARFPNEYPGCDRALHLLQSALTREDKLPSLKDSSRG